MKVFQREAAGGLVLMGATPLALEQLCHDVLSPLQRMEHEMNHWVIFGVMPTFVSTAISFCLSAPLNSLRLRHPGKVP